MKKSELIKQLQDQCIEDTDDFEIKAHHRNSEEFTIDFTFWHEGCLYLALLPIKQEEQK